ncbi:hypothetical protein [Phytohabitans rumicis]|uniref:Uncharacterized protein n=1 Tax=Phytohabitans rumicis TaxID=1076125 RepID=A0A6V8KVC4_9ACTN|nr:hypothetical protein [Phytohabitans rumicis]GFJ86668.1 hypothetical protein Prum_003100 [Phytohabitans rumicis]
MASITSWQRLEPVPRDPAMPGLAGRVADPLWMLARQWQVGELTGEDTGSPVRVDLTVEIAHLSRYRPGVPDGIAGSPLDRTLPLEAVVEAEPPAPPGDQRAAAVAGARLLALLGPLAVQVRTGLLAAHAIDPPPAYADPAVGRRAELLRRQVPDGHKLHAALAAAHKAGDVTTALPGLDRRDQAALAAAATAATGWLDWYATRAVPAGGTPPAWRPDRLEYELSVAAAGATSADERVLVANDHDGGRLDWWSFELHQGATLGANRDAAPDEVTSSTLPAGLVLTGLPASRFWEFEAGEVNLDAVSAAPEDLGRLLLTEFAVAYGNDFFLVPVEVDAGSVASVRGLTVRNTFGETIPIPTAADADRTAGRAPFRLFQPTVGAGGTPGGAVPLLILVPGAAPGLEGEPVEEVLLARDEMANVAWAVERRVPGPDGRAAERAEALHRATPQTPIADGSPHAPSLHYQLATGVPANWLPLLPHPTAASGAARPVLRLRGPTPTGRLLTPGTEIHAERLGRTGVTLHRRAERARAGDGRTVVWMSRRRATGRGESSSGLRFDQLSADAD